MLEETRRSKSFTLLSGTGEGWTWNISIQVCDNGAFHAKGAIKLANEKELYIKHREKDIIRSKDRLWVYLNIPSSIWWFSEVHHDWNNGGVMYLLTKGEHILRHRREKQNV